jgi:hypothetical protein
VIYHSDACMMADAVAEMYHASGSWVRLLKQRRRETGDIAPRRQLSLPKIPSRPARGAFRAIHQGQMPQVNYSVGRVPPATEDGRKAMTRRLAMGAAVSLCLGLVLLGAVASICAQGTEPIKATAGVEIKIASGEGITVVDPQPTRGKVRSEQDSGAKTSSLSYTANDTDVPSTDSVTYKIGQGEPKKVDIQIAPKATRNPQSGFSDDAYPEAFKALFLLFVIAVILESALAILFNWRPFVETFNARAVRPVISFALASVLVAHFDLDLVTTLSRLIRPGLATFDLTGKILTAMVIAGGSAGVNNLMVGLGFRQVRTPETAVPKPPAKQGWISVSIVRDQAKGLVSVFIGTQVNGKTPFAGVVEKSTHPRLRYFFRDPGRFPGSGGYAVASGFEVMVEVTANNKTAGQPLLSKTWGPNLIADGAIIDLTFEM